MDAKEVKSALKAAREAIRNKEYKDALKHCKAVLKHDKTNYNALVFVGVAAEGMEQAEQALMAYRKATEAEPEQVLAWQGLCGFYEKSGKAEYQQELVAVYDKLITLHDKDMGKKQELGLKLGQLCRVLKDDDKALDVYQGVAEWSQDNTGQLSQAWTAILGILEAKPQRSPDHNALVVRAYDVLVHQCADACDNLQQIWAQYLDTLLKDGNVSSEKVKTECEGFLEQYPDSTRPLDILGLLYVNATTCGLEIGIDIANVESQLSEREPDSPILALIQGLQKLQQTKYKDAITLLSQGVCSSSVGSVASGWLLLAEAQYHIHDNMAADKSARKGIKQVESSGGVVPGGAADVLADKLQTLLCQILTDLNTDASMAHAMDIIHKHKSRGSLDPTLQVCLVKLHIQQQDYTAAKKELGDMRELPVGGAHLEGYCAFQEGDMETAKDRLVKVTESQGDAALAWYWLARVHWRLQDYDSCFPALLQAAKLDSYLSGTFLYLGHYYRQVLGDNGKARRCYSKAFEVDGQSEEIGAALVDCLVNLGENETATQLLQSITSQATPGSGKWAWLRLGLQQLKEDDPTLAIASLQSALRADPRDVHVWECVGDAYRKRGSFTAALKAFTKATELDPDAIYPLYQIASIKQTLGLFAEAVPEYEGILANKHDYVPALKGLGETLLSLAKIAVGQCLYGKAATYCQNAVLQLTRAAVSRPDLSCVWKLIADCCTILHQAPQHLKQLTVPGKLLNANDDLEVTKVVKGQQLLALGGRCYGMALKQHPDCSSLWHDLGLSYFYQAESAESNPGPVAMKAIQALQKAVSLSPTNHQHWTALGVVAASSYIEHPGLAQHCFIKSIEVEANNAEAWTNLGTLYLKNEKVELAHQAFKSAQSLDPGFVACWIGQALIAETVGHHDTMDLFRHTTILGTHAEGSIGYAHWVCSTLQDKVRQDDELYRYSIQEMAAIPAASDALSKYLDQFPDNATAHNMHGLLLERQGLYKQAVKAMARCVELLPGAAEDLLQQATANYARLLCQAGNYEESLEQFSKLSGNLSKSDIWWQALALYKTGRLQESLQAYESSLSLTDSPSEISHIHAAMGIVAYKMGDIDSAKAAFFTSFQQSEPSVHGLDALCSLGLLQQDYTLVTAVLQELAKLGDNPDTSHHTSYLTAMAHAMQGDVEGGRRILTKAIHDHPERALLWRNLSLFLLHLQPNKQALPAMTCAMAATKMAGKGLSQEDECAATLASLGGGCHSRYNPTYNCLQQAQKAVHRHPDQLSSWCGLVSAMYAESVVESEKSRLTQVALTLATHLMSQVEAELQSGLGNKVKLQELHLWSVKQYVMLLLALGRVEQAKQFIQQAVWLYEGDPVLQSLSEMLQQNFRGLRKLAKQHDNTFLWQVLLQSLTIQGLVKEVKKNLESITQDSILDVRETCDKTERYTGLAQLCHLAYQQILTNQADRDQWKQVLRDTAADLKESTPDDSTGSMLQALLLIQENNNRVAKHHLQQVLENQQCSSIGEVDTVARQHLLGILMAKDDPDAIQNLRANAEEMGDMKFLEYFDNFQK